MDVEPLRYEIERLLRELAEETYLQQAGLRQQSRLARVYERHAHLVQQARLEEARAAAAEGGATPSLRPVREFLTHAVLEAEIADVTDRFLSEEAGASITVEERTLPLRGADAAICDEADRAKRATLEQASASAVSRLNPLLQERLERLEEAVARLGATSYPALWQALSGIDLDALEKLSHELLARTEEMYRDVLTWMLKRRLGVPIAEARRHDLTRLFRGAEFDRLPLSGGIADAASAAARKMRIDPTAGGRIQIDGEARPTKTSRAFVAPLEVPARVILVMQPRGGWEDALAHLRGLGQALHLANTDPALPVEFRRLGDASLSEVFGCLLEGLLLEPGFLRRFLGIAHERDFLHVVTLHKLYRLRRDAATLLYERCLYTSPSYVRMADAYRDLLSRASGVQFPSELYLYDMEPAFAVARTLRGFIFEAQLRGYLYDRFDEEWYRNDRTGPFLLELWRQGFTHTLQDLATQLSLGPLQIDPLISRVTRHLD